MKSYYVFLMKLNDFMSSFLKIGLRYPCYYHKQNTTLVLWDLPDTTKDVMALILILFGVVSYMILVIFHVWCQNPYSYSNIGQIVQDGP